MASEQHKNAAHRLEFRGVFDKLAEDGSQQGRNYQAYAHHLARACWHGTRIMLRQTSPEAEGIFDFILALHGACDGNWTLFQDSGATKDQVEAWLDYAALFLSSIGNYFEEGGRKVIPKVPKDILYKMASILHESNLKLQHIIEPLTDPQPASLGYTGATSQSTYYPGPQSLSKEEIEAVTRKMELEKIAPENTRLQKRDQDDGFEILQASAEQDSEPRLLGDIMVGDQGPFNVYLRRGDHASQMIKICDELTAARELATTEEQRTTLSQLIDSFRTGNYESFRAALKTWVTDKAPRVEHCMGFLFGYRDPHGVRAEWQAAAGIADKEETLKMAKLVDMSTSLIRTLPWAVPGLNDGKGPFEPSELDVPDFAIIHVLASVSCTVWEATNITIDDEGKRQGVKNMVYGNRLNLNSKPGRPCPFLRPADAELYMRSAHIVRFIQTAVHELLGHGTGKLLVETNSGSFNFDHDNPPVSPVTGKPIESWYKPGQTWNTVFGKLAPTVEECRAFLVADYLSDNKDILAMFGYNESSTPTANDLVYCMYLHVGVEGLRALRSFNVSDQTWGGDHEQAQFAILKHVLQDADDVFRVEIDSSTDAVYVGVDRTRMISHGKPSIGRMLCNIQIWHATADVKACRPYYDGLSVVDGEFEKWRQVVASKSEPRWKFVQPNTFLEKDGTITLREYEESDAGVVKSFFERRL